MRRTVDNTEEGVAAGNASGRGRYTACALRDGQGDRQRVRGREGEVTFQLVVCCAIHREMTPEGLLG